MQFSWLKIMFVRFPVRILVRLCATIATGFQTAQNDGWYSAIVLYILTVQDDFPFTCDVSSRLGGSGFCCHLDDRTCWIHDRRRFSVLLKEFVPVLN